MRAMMSVEPAGAVGTMKVMGFDGQVSAFDAAAAVAAVSASRQWASFMSCLL